MASVQVTETSVSIDATITKSAGAIRVAVVTKSGTDVAAIPYGREASDVLFGPGVDLLPANVKAGLVAFLDWVEAQAKARWTIP